MVFIHIILHKLTGLLASFDIYYYYLMNYTKFNVNEKNISLVYLTTLPDLLLNSKQTCITRQHFANCENYSLII